MQCWDVETGEVLHTFTGHQGKVHCVCTAPDGDTFFSGGEGKHSLAMSRSPPAGARTACMVMLAFANIAACTDWPPTDKTIKLWRISTGTCFHTIQPDPYGKSSHSDEVLAVAIAPDQSIMASASADNTIRTWKVIGL